MNRAPAMRLFCILCGSRTVETRPHSEAVSRARRDANPLNAPHTEAAPHPPCTANPRNAPPLLGFSARPEGSEVSERTPAIRLAHMVRGSCALEVRPRSEATPRYPGVREPSGRTPTLRLPRMLRRSRALEIRRRLEASPHAPRVAPPRRAFPLQSGRRFFPAGATWSPSRAFGEMRF